MTAKDAWNKFEQTGKIDDYLQYRQVYHTGQNTVNGTGNNFANQKEHTGNGGKNNGADTQAPQFR